MVNVPGREQAPKLLAVVNRVFAVASSYRLKMARMKIAQ